MQTYRLAIIGFGNVGQGFVSILRDRRDELARRYGALFQVVAVSDMLKGSVYEPDGLEPAALLESVEASGNLDRVPGRHSGWDALRTIAESNADVVVELSYTDLKSGEPAFTHMRHALNNKKHVVTTNKGPIALHYTTLLDIARAQGVEIGVEGTVMSGTPTLHLGRDLLAAATIYRIQGILNGTTNYILTRMEEGASYDAALAEAQERGYAEADPTGDVEGFDAAAKVVILARLLMDLPLTMADVERRGITGLTPEQIAEARAANQHWRLIGAIEKSDDGYKASVLPMRLSSDHPLATIRGVTNAMTYSTELLGDITLIGPGAGRLQTGYAVLSDLVHIHRKRVATDA